MDTGNYRPTLVSNDVPSCGTCWWRIATALVTRRSALLEQGGEDLLPGGEEILEAIYSTIQMFKCRRRTFSMIFLQPSVKKSH